MTTEGNTFFRKLNEAEKKSLLIRLQASKEPNLVIWNKKKNNKRKCKVLKIEKENYVLTLSNNVLGDFDNKEILYTFELLGLHYFGQAEVIEENDVRKLHCNGEFFKSERRASYRLLTYPHHSLFAEIHLPHEKTQSGNLVNFNTGKSQTALFENFLNLIDSEEEKLVRDQHLKFRVIDISVTGMAIQYGEIEAKLIDQIQGALGTIYLDFNGEEIVIPGAEILYKVPYLAKDKKTRLYKAGLQFLNVETNLDEQLGLKINEILRSKESDFEDFV